MKTNLIKKFGARLFLALVLSLLLFSPRILSNAENNKVNLLKQNTSLQDSIITIVGEVVDLNHQPLEGVVVRDNNTTIEKLTDGEGRFELSLDTATVISFTKTGFYSVEHMINKSDSNLVIILTPESNQLIVKGYSSPSVMDGEAEMFDMDTTSTLKQKYDLMNDSIDSKSMKMDATDLKKDNHMHMDTIKTVKLLHHNNDSTKKMKSNVVEKQ